MFDEVVASSSLLGLKEREDFLRKSPIKERIPYC